MSSLSHAAPSLAFVSLPPGAAAAAAVAWQVSSRQPRFFFSTVPLNSFAESEPEDSSETSHGKLPSVFPQNSNNASNTQQPTAATSAPNMGASIGAQNVGEMLFNEQLLKSGRGDVRVGPMRRWKDFRGNEIVPDNAVDGPN
eukprot:scaffold14099_cov71-Skeletonema_dohrnii-CCMP3373.AAC.2